MSRKRRELYPQRASRGGGYRTPPAAGSAVLRPTYVDDYEEGREGAASRQKNMMSATKSARASHSAAAPAHS